MPPGFAHSVPPAAQCPSSTRGTAASPWWWDRVPSRSGRRCTRATWCAASAYGQARPRPCCVATYTKLRNQIAPIEHVLPGPGRRTFAPRWRTTPATTKPCGGSTICCSRWRSGARRWTRRHARGLRGDRGAGQVAVARLAKDAGVLGPAPAPPLHAGHRLSPKEFARVRRLRHSIVKALGNAERRWVELAAACGYADQAHLVKEYKRLSGLAPQAILAHLARIRHGQRDALSRGQVPTRQPLTSGLWWCCVFNNEEQEETGEARCRRRAAGRSRAGPGPPGPSHRTARASRSDEPAGVPRRSTWKSEGSIQDGRRRNGASTGTKRSSGSSAAWPW